MAKLSFKGIPLSPMSVFEKIMPSTPAPQTRASYRKGLIKEDIKRKRIIKRRQPSIMAPLEDIETLGGS
jgi:hypothetical protein